MTVPDDLIVDARDQKIILRSGDRTIEIVNDGRYGPFANGPITWKHFVLRYLTPALSQLNQPESPAVQRAGWHG